MIHVFPLWVSLKRKRSNLMHGGRYKSKQASSRFEAKGPVSLIGEISGGTYEVNSIKGQAMAKMGKLKGLRWS